MKCGNTWILTPRNHHSSFITHCKVVSKNSMVLWSYACKFIVMNVSPAFWKRKGCWTYDCFHIYPKITYHFNSGLEVLNIVPAFWQWKDNHLFQLRRLQTLKQVIYKKLKKLHTAVEKSVQRNIFIWSYFVPPWCYITKTRLLKLKQHELSVFFNMRNDTSPAEKRPFPWIFWIWVHSEIHENDQYFVVQERIK